MARHRRRPELKKLNSPRGIGFAIAPLADIIFSVAVVIVVLVAHQMVAVDLTAKQRSVACNTEGVVAYAATHNLMGTLMQTIAPYIGMITNALENAYEIMEEFIDGIDSALGAFSFIVGILLLVLAVALIAFLSTVSFGAALVFIPLIMGFMGADLIWDPPTMGGLEDFESAIDAMEDLFQGFSHGDSSMNVAMVGGCQSGLFLEHKPPDLAIALAEEIDLCLERGR